MSFKTTIYFQDFCQYYNSAKILQEANLRGVKVLVNDQLMDNIPIYDTVQRCYAGFSNIPQQLWYGSANPKQHQAKTNYDHLKQRWSQLTWIYVLLVHRVTGSGASFATDHGFRNSILPNLAQLDNIENMVSFIKTYEKPMFTSIGNQIPPFPKPIGDYRTGGKLYLCEYAPKLCRYLIEVFNDVGYKTMTIQQAVDLILTWHRQNKLKQFKFVLTALAMDIAEYYPDLVDPFSHCYYGKNCLETLDLIFEDKSRKQDDQKMEFLCELFNAKPMDMEDVLCDYIRYVENYIPKGYKYFKNNSLIKDHHNARQA